MRQTAHHQSAATLDDLGRTSRAVRDQYLTFLIGGERYALPLLDVIEIVEYRTPTPLPMAPREVRGVLDLRGRAVPVVDLATLLDGGDTEITRRTSVIILATAGTGGQGGADRQLTGVLVDAVDRVLALGDDDIEPPPTVAGARSDCVRGVARDDDRFVMILDAARTF